MAKTTSVDRRGWVTELNRLSEEHQGDLVTIEVLDRTFGDQHEVERLPLAYAAHDPRDDVVVIAVGGRSSRYPVVLRHMIWHPTDVDVATPGTVAALRVVEPDGTATLVTFLLAQDQD